MAAPERLPPGQAGFGLVEVMVALLVLAVGMLGIGAALTTTLQNNQSAMLHNQAAFQAQAALDLLRANKAGAVIGRYDLSRWTCQAPSDDNPEGAALAAWMDGLKDNLGPGACGAIACTNLGCSVEVRWDDSGDLAGEVVQSYRLDTRL